jgi:putative spermidine/putrescine transport system substrate-binding protein
MKRRRMLAALVLAAGAAGLTGCAGNGAAAAGAGDPQTLVVYSGGDTNVQQLWEQTLIPGFEKANPGVTVTLQFDLHDQNTSQVLAKIAAATQQGQDPGIDVVDSVADRAGQADLLADPTGRMPNLSAVPQDVLASVAKNAFPYRASSVLLAYDPAKVPNPPTSLDALLAWIRANPGRFAYNSPNTGGSGDSFVQTVLSRYLPADVQQQMTSGYHQDLEKAWDPGFQVLTDLNKSVYQAGVYPNGNNATMQLLQSGEIWMAPVWSDQFLSAQQTGSLPPTVKAVQITDPSFTGSATQMGVLKASTKQDLAFRLANWILDPAQQAAIATAIAGYPAISLDALPADVQARFAGTDPGNLRPGFNADMDSDMKNLWGQKVPGH